MKILITFIFVMISFELEAQNGYVKLNDSDSIIVGYLKYYNSISEGQGIEVWRTKKDKNPLKLLKNDISEYAIKKDTFRILKDFTPFPDKSEYFEIVESLLLSSGKVNLLVIQNYQNPNKKSLRGNSYYVSNLPIEISTRNVTYMYIIENSASGYIRALPKQNEKLRETLAEFFPEKYLTKYSEVKEKITYSAIPALVKLYNSK